MNTVGKPGRLGGETRCVVSVAMLTEGWDANTVTHVLGVRAFGTQLLCEQVIGRALRRQSYDLNEEGVFNVEYADVLGVPFDFTAKPVAAPVQPPRESVQVMAISPDRDRCEIRFPRVHGYRVELPEERVQATFDANSTIELTPELVGPSKTRVEGIIGEGVDLDLEHLDELRRTTLVYHLTKRLIETSGATLGRTPSCHLFGQLKRITAAWLDDHLECKGGTYPALLMYQDLADMACERITRGIVASHLEERTRAGRARSVQPRRFDGPCSLRDFQEDPMEDDGEPVPRQLGDLRQQLGGGVLPRRRGTPPRSCVRQEPGSRFRGPYRLGSQSRRYIPDFIVRVDDGHGEEDLLNLVVEIKGYRGEDAKEKAATMDRYWVPGVNRLGTYGRWAFAEFTDVYLLEADFAKKVEEGFGNLVSNVVTASNGADTAGAAVEHTAHAPA